MKLVFSMLVAGALGLPAAANAQDIANVPRTPSAHWLQVQPTTISAHATALPAGTQLYARMDNTVGTGSGETTHRFTATLEAQVQDSYGRVIIPTGAQLVGRVTHAERRTRGAQLVLAIEGVRINGNFVPLSADIVQAESETHRGGWRAAQNLRLSQGAPIQVQLTSSVPVASLTHAAGNSMRGGGPR